MVNVPSFTIPSTLMSISTIPTAFLGRYSLAPRSLLTSWLCSGPLRRTPCEPRVLAASGTVGHLGVHGYFWVGLESTLNTVVLLKPLLVGTREPPTTPKPGRGGGRWSLFPISSISVPNTRLQPKCRCLVSRNQKQCQLRGSLSSGLKVALQRVTAGSGSGLLQGFGGSLGFRLSGV